MLMDDDSRSNSDSLSCLHNLPPPPPHPPNFSLLNTMDSKSRMIFFVVAAAVA